ncbi:MAG: 6-phosphogluconolactonase [Chloroflexi bacterium]|nr:MAG: 6-phosphogluconolactonase [Chloroflexota bacterium]
MANVRVETFSSYAEMSQAAAALFSHVAQTAVNERGRFLVALAGGNTPRQLYQLLAQPPYKTTIPWAKTILLWGDERLVPPDHPESNYKQVADLLLAHVPITPENVFRMKGELPAETAVADYTTQLKKLAENGRNWPHLDLAIMGMGRDGHTASLFPGPISPAETSQPVMLATAHYNGRPAHRITLTPLVFNDARHILFLVSGANKQATLQQVLHGTYEPEKWPAQRITPKHGKLIWYIHPHN